jgi:hypothetical protein
MRLTFPAPAPWGSSVWMEYTSALSWRAVVYKSYRQTGVFPKASASGWRGNSLYSLSWTEAEILSFLRKNRDRVLFAWS